MQKHLQFTLQFFPILPELAVIFKERYGKNLTQNQSALIQP